MRGGDGEGEGRRPLVKRDLMEEDWLARPQLIAPSLEENQCSLDEVPHLDVRIRECLTQAGFHSLFPVQKAVFEGLKASEEGDLLVSASTGSGKTLAYSLPIVNALASRLVVRLRALIVVPGRELAQQVGAVLEPLCAATGLSTTVVVGQTSMIAEQKKLVSSLGQSNVDILVATPGRLVDHLKLTSGFSLQHLEWLIIDEADRLLDQNFQDWLPLVLGATNGSNTQSEEGIHTIRASQAPIHSLFGLHCWTTPLRKLLFSATLTKNPAKLAQLHLKQPVFLSVSNDSTKHTVPDDLEEHMIVTEDGEKVHVLIHLLQSNRVSRALCFTKSVEATDKLSSLLRAALPETSSTIAAFSSDLLPARRQEILAQFNAGTIDLLVCSDGAARGLDLERVDAVVNYDIPVHVKTYIHRVGRTARAGNQGTAYSLLESREAHHFKRMLDQGRSGKSPVQKIKIQPEVLQPIRDLVEQAIGILQGDQLIQAVMQHYNR